MTGYPNAILALARELIIPFELGFGEEGNDRVPPHSNLKYFVELVSISPGRRHPAGEEL